MEMKLIAPLIKSEERALTLRKKKYKIIMNERRSKNSKLFQNDGKNQNEGHNSNLNQTLTEGCNSFDREWG